MNLTLPIPLNRVTVAQTDASPLTHSKKKDGERKEKPPLFVASSDREKTVKNSMNKEEKTIIQEEKAS